MIESQGFHQFREKLARKCRENGIELRTVSQWYPFSKTCHSCGYVKKDLKLSERTYVRPCCWYTKDRDFNAALDLRDAVTYRTA